MPAARTAATPRSSTGANTRSAACNTSQACDVSSPGATRELVTTTSTAAAGTSGAALGDCEVGDVRVRQARDRHRQRTARAYVLGDGLLIEVDPRVDRDVRVGDRLLDRLLPGGGHLLRVTVVRVDT